MHLSVCLSFSEITQKRVHGFGWNVACRQMSGHGRTDQLLSPIWIIVRMPEPDCFLRYRMCCNAEFYYVGKLPHIGIGRLSLKRCVVLEWFYFARAVETTLLKVNALYRVPCPSSFVCVKSLHLATSEMWCSGESGILTELSLCYRIVWYHNGDRSVDWIRLWSCLV